MAKIIKLRRKWKTIDGLYGELTIQEQDEIIFRCYTVERHWLDNKPSISCIPVGEYPLVLGYYHKGRYATYELQDTEPRTEIKIHIANVPSELEGCIGLGLAFGHVKEQYAVLYSGMAHKKFMQVMQNTEDTTIVITNEVTYGN